MQGRQSAPLSARSMRASMSPGSKSMVQASPRKPLQDRNGDASARDTIRATQSLLSTLHAPEDATKAYLSLHALKDTLGQYRTLEEDPLATDPGLALDWDLYRDEPGALEAEEEELKAYYRKLKFIYLEQETKLRFLADLQDDPETGQEPQILTVEDVKMQLVEAKTRVRELRADIDELADSMKEPWGDLEDGEAEALDLMAGISDMELELARIRAAEGMHGTMTAAEAVAKSEEQVEEMQRIETETSEVTHALEKTKMELKQSSRALERLKAERSAAEKLANEAQLGAGRDRGRDWELERVCARHTTMLHQLHESLALHALHAPTPETLEVVFAPTAVDGASPGTLRLTWDVPGGQLLGYELEDAHGAPLALSHEASLYVDAALESNQPAALVQRVWQEM